MSKIIKAAELKVLIPNESQTVIPAPKKVGKESETAQGTVLEAANLVAAAQAKAAEILAAAESGAKQVAAQAQAEKAAIQERAEKEGFEQGLEKGLQEGREEASKKADSFLQLLEDTIEAAALERAKALAMLEEDFLKFSLILADKMVKKAVNEDVSWLGPIVREGLSRLGNVGKITVRLHPEDYALTQRQQEDLQLANRAQLHFEMDTAISRGGCLIESDQGAIDARLEKRLGKLAQHLLEVLYNGES